MSLKWSVVLISGCFKFNFIFYFTCKCPILTLTSICIFFFSFDFSGFFLPILFNGFTVTVFPDRYFYLVIFLIWLTYPFLSFYNCFLRLLFMLSANILVVVIVINLDSNCSDIFLCYSYDFIFFI